MLSVLKRKQAESRGGDQACIHLQKPFPHLSRTDPDRNPSLSDLFSSPLVPEIHTPHCCSFLGEGHLSGQSRNPSSRGLTWAVIVMACSLLADFWRAWAEVTGAYKNQAVTARKLMCVTTESTEGKNFETF